MSTALWEGIGGWHWSLDTDDAVYSGLRATEAEARAEMDGVMRDLRAQDAAQVDTLRARARAEAAEQRAEAAEAEVGRLRSAIAETLRLADIYAGVAAHNAEAEPETAGEAWRSPYMATMRELRRALGGAA